MGVLKFLLLVEMSKDQSPHCKQISKMELVLTVAGGHCVCCFAPKPGTSQCLISTPRCHQKVTLLFGFSFETDRVTERCESLCLLAEQPQCTTADKENIMAVINDYEHGMSIPKPGYAVLYFGGKRMSEEVLLSGISVKDKIDEWSMINGGGGRIMVESVQDSKFQFAATTTYPSLGPRGHHMVRRSHSFYPINCKYLIANRYQPNSFISIRGELGAVCGFL